MSLTEEEKMITTNKPITNSQSQRIDNSEIIRRHLHSLGEKDSSDMSTWLSTLNKYYDDWNYSSSQRLIHVVTHLSADQKVWYDKNKVEINGDWTHFCERLNQYISDRKINPMPTLTTDNSMLSNTESVMLEELIDAKFSKYPGVGDAKTWLLQTMNQFKESNIRRADQFLAIPLLLEGDAYFWYAEHAETIYNFEKFSKMFLQQYAPTTLSQSNNTVGTSAAALAVPDNTSTSHLQRIVADEIIKRPTYFRGSQDDVHDWLDKLEQRFVMAQWNDDNKLHYISIHLQDDAYRWWMQTSSTIKTWSSFKDAVIRAFGSTRAQELAFEQLKWYKQTINQSTTQYYDKIIELCRKVDPMMPDSLKLKYLMAGIKDSLKTHVALQDPRTTESFLSSARKIEDVLSLTNTNNEPFDKDITIINTTKYQSQPPNQPNFIQTANNTSNQNSRYANAARTRTTYNRNSSTSNNANRENKFSRNIKSTQRSNVCFNCGTPGHYARDCTRPHFQ